MSSDDFLRGLVVWTMEMRRKMEFLHSNCNKILFPGNTDWKEKYDALAKKPTTLSLEDLDL